jgi:RHS repeat-associated protein
VVGGIASTFAVGPNGDARYTIPIDAPPGVNGVEPGLALTYGSQSGDGLLGVGWSLGGLSAITRCKQIPAIDQARGTIGYDAADRYCLDGRRLINVSGAYGSAGSVYRAELETWQKVVASNELCGSGPCSFTVRTSDGATLVYGGTVDSRALAAAKPSSGATTARPDVRVWALSSARDRNGNTLAVTYTAAPLPADAISVADQSADGQIYPLRVDYTANAAAGLTANRSLRFGYAARADVTTVYQGGSPITMRARLATVTAYVEEKPVRQYQVSYQNGASTGRSRVAEVRLCAGSGDAAPCLTPTTFDAQDTDGISLQLKGGLGQISTDRPILFAADIDGDGRGDIVSATQDNPPRVWVQRAVPTGFDLCPQGTKLGSSFDRVLPADVDGDGKVDLAVVYASGGGTFVQPYLAGADGCTFTAGEAARVADARPADVVLIPADADGDGRTDLLVETRSGHGSSVLVSLATSRGTSFQLADQRLHVDMTGASSSLLAMDVDGDARVDLVRVDPKSTGEVVATAYLARDLSAPVDSPLPGAPVGAANLGTWPMDVNGDGLMDLTMAWADSKGSLQISTFVATGDGHFAARPVVDTKTAIIPAKSRLLQLDMNGDGRTDLVQLWVEGNVVTLVVYRSAGSGFVTGPNVKTTLGPNDLDRLYAMDLDGDGRADFVQASSSGAGQRTLVACVTQGPAPDLVAGITDGLGGRIEVTYAPLSDGQVYEPAATAPAHPLSEVRRQVFTRTPAAAPFQVVGGGAMNVVAATVTRNAAAGALAPYTYEDRYAYAGGLVDRQGRGWLGFARQSHLDVQTGRRTVTAYNQAFPLTGTTAWVAAQCDATVPAPDPLCPTGKTDTPLSVEKTAYASVVTATGATAPSPAVYLVEKTAGQTDEYSYGQYVASQRREYAYDAFGNVVRESDLGAVDASGANKDTADDVHMCARYQNDTAAWVIGLPSDTKVSLRAQCDDFASFDAKSDASLTHVEYTSDGAYRVKSRSRWDDRNEGNLTVTYEYDALGHVTAETLPGNRRSTSTYEARFSTYLEKQTHPANASGTALVEWFGFDPSTGTLVAHTDAAGSTQITCLDVFGRVAKVQGSPIAGAQTPRDPSCVTAGVTGAAARSFQSAELVTLSAHARGAEGSAIYDEVTTLESWSAGTPDLGFQRTYLDGLGRAVATVQQGDPASGNVLACTIPDGAGKPVRASIPMFIQGKAPDCASPALWTTTAYDVYGRVTIKRRPSGPDGSGIATTTITYPDTRTARITYAAGSASAYEKDVSTRLLHGRRVVDKVIVPAEKATTQLGYDAFGRLVSAVDPPTKDNPSGVANTVAYDSLGRVITVANPDQNTTGAGVALAREYGADGLLRATTDAKGQKTVFTYDGLARPLTTTLADGTMYTFTYDDPGVAGGAGRLTRVEGKKAGATLFTYDYAYDAHGNETDRKLTIAGQSYLTRETFDPRGRARTHVYPDGDTLVRTYAHGDLTSVAMGGVTHASFSDFTALGNPRTVKYGNGTSVKYAYAPQGELIGQRAQLTTGAAVLDLGLTWDDLGEVTRIDDRLAAPGRTDFSQSFTYGNRRLLGADAPGLYGSRAFAYDTSGNLISNAGTSYRYQAHRVVAGTRDGRSVLSASYDANGNMVGKKQDDVSWSYVYDARNRLTSVQRGEASALSVPLYDHADRRLQKRDPVSGTTVLYADALYTLTRAADGAVSATKTIPGPMGPVATVTKVVAGSGNRDWGPGEPTPGTLYFLSDHLGSTALTLNEAGAVGSRVAYLPYGGVYVDKSTGPDNFRPKFQGKEVDAQSGLQYFGARYYDPTIGRFLSPDTRLGDHLYRNDALNRFAFACNSPLTFVDPTGHDVWESIVGVVVGRLEIAAGLVIDVLSDGVLADVGNTLISAGVDSIAYSATHAKNFSWKQYAVRQGMDLAIGLATMGFGIEMSSSARAAEEAASLESRAAEHAMEDSMAAMDRAEGRELESSAAGHAEGRGERRAGSDALEDGAGPCGNSFPAGTLVQTESGPRPIESIAEGDRVLSQSDGGGPTGSSLVVARYVATANDFVTLVVAVDGDAPEPIRATAGHPFWVHDRGWITAGKVRAGDEIYAARGAWARVLSATRGAGHERVYNFAVASTRSYFVGRAGVWVHNLWGGGAKCQNAWKRYRPPWDPDETTIKNQLFERQRVYEGGKELIVSGAGTGVRAPRNATTGAGTTLWQIDHIVPWRYLKQAAKDADIRVSWEDMRAACSDLSNLRLITAAENASHDYELVEITGGVAHRMTDAEAKARARQIVRKAIPGITLFNN